MLPKDPSLEPFDSKVLDLPKRLVCLQGSVGKWGCPSVGTLQSIQAVSRIELYLIETIDSGLEMSGQRTLFYAEQLTALAMV